MKITAFSKTDKSISSTLVHLRSALIGLLVIPGLYACGGSSDGAPKAVPPVVSIANASIAEGNSGIQTLSFNVTLDKATSSVVSVDYATSDGTAVAGIDYTAKTGTLNIAANSTTATITVDVEGDTAFEFDETLVLDLSNPKNASLSTAKSATGTITDEDDANPQGYFAGSGTFNSVVYPDVTALAYNNIIYLFSATANDLYKITITSITGDAFSGDVEFYNDGSIDETGLVTISGTTNESRIQASFTGGSGIAEGTFDILYDTSNNNAATFVRAQAPSKPWEGNFKGFDDDTGRIFVNTDNIYSGLDDNTERCGFIEEFTIPDSTVNIYYMSHDIIDGGGFTCNYLSTGYTGYAAVIDVDGPADRMIFAFSNSEKAFFASGLNRRL